ncbi:hypothetical protein J6590_060285 [Homalodisca vitripennis]|nr:hypothetical protein J6590_060285 [Homalodisca vitripennis]
MAQCRRGYRKITRRNAERAAHRPGSVQAPAARPGWFEVTLQNSDPKNLKNAYYGITILILRMVRLSGNLYKAVSVLDKLNYRESCRETFGKFGLLTLLCLYVYEVIMYCRSRCVLIRGRDNIRIQQFRLTLSQHLPQQFGVKLINNLSEGIKKYNNRKTRLKCLLVP